MRNLIRSPFTRAVFASLSLSSAAWAGDGAESCGAECCGTPFDNGCGEYQSCGESLFGCIDPMTSPQLTGDWFGNRTALLDSGIKFDASVANFYTGVVSGGVEQTGRYAGHGDYVMNIDGDKLLGMKGMFVKIRAEHRFGESIGEPSGALLPPNIAADLPDPLTEEVILTDVLFTQMFSETFGVFFGKLDTLDGDQNAFASGRGVTQFSNSAFVCTPIGFRTIPYSTLGTGFVILQDLQPIFTFSVLNARNTIREVGISELFNDGAVIAPELRIPTDFFDLPGHQLFGGTWSSRNYVSLDQDPRIILPSVPIARASDSWSLYYNFDQHLVVFDEDPTKGWGLFGRAGIADEQTNPIGWFLSAGVGGNSPISGRSNDTFGAGYYYASTSDKIGPVLAKVVGGIGDSHGTELFYNYEVTRWFHLTADAQFITPAREAIDDTVLLGLRGVVTF